LEALCRAYWYPLYAYVRRKGYVVDDAQDLTQAFFARMLEKNYVAQADCQRGRFRTFLLAALNHFLADEWDKTRRLKRGGRQEIISFDAISAEERYRMEPLDHLDAVKLYERRWVTTLFDQVLARLEDEFRGSGKGEFIRSIESLAARRRTRSKLRRVGRAAWSERGRGEADRPSNAPAVPGTVP
jgi:RNA polymerase sigma-70 factor (ECF subfamily)